MIFDAAARRCFERVLASEERENGVERHDLTQTPLAAIVDDARSLSLFATNRVIWVSGAEAALPRGRAASAGENSAVGESGEYLKHPMPAHAGV